MQLFGLTVSDLGIVALMILVFVLAVLLPYPGGRSDEGSKGGSR